MSIGFSSAARNLFLLGSSGEQVVTNFFKTIDQSAGTDGVYIPDEIKYNFVDQKFVLAGSASDSNSKGFGWFEKRNEAGTADFENRIESTQSGVNTTLRAMELDSNDNLIVVGKTGNVPWIAKYSNGGVIDWQSTTNSGEVEYTGITSSVDTVTNLVNYYACGNTPTSGEAQAFVEKFDVSGNPGWGKSAFMLGRDVVLNRIAANARGEVVAVGYLEDDIYNKGYIIKIDTNTGEVLWDRTLSPDWQGDMLNCSDVYIDSNDQIYVTVNGTFVGYLIKYTAEGNMIWQKTTDDPSSTITFDQVKSDGETEQTVVFGTYDDGSGDVRGVLSKYSKNGSLVWRRTLLSTYNSSDYFSNVCLDADPSFYYLLFVDDLNDGFSGTPDRYTFGKVSSSGNGLGNFSYFPDSFDVIDYTILSVGDKIGRLSDGSVRQDTSDLITYPFNANKLLFDDLATQVSNKKRQMDGPDSFEYSGSPAIRPADFQELNLLGDNVSGRTWTDTSGKGNNGVASLTEPFLGAGSTSFDGSSGYFTMPDSEDFNIGSSDFTIEFWLYKKNTSTYQHVFRQRDSAAAEMAIVLDIDSTGGDSFASGYFQMEWGANKRFVGVNAGLTNDTWHHLALTKEGTTGRVFVDGVLVGTDTLENVGNYSGDFYVGYWVGGLGYYFSGYMSDFRIVKGTALYTSNFTPPTTQLTNIPGTVLLTCQGDSIVDASPSSHPITITGSVAPTNDGPTWNASGWWDYSTNKQYIDVNYPDNLIATGFTVEFWFNGISTLPGQTAQFLASQGRMGLSATDNDSTWRIERNNSQDGTIEFNVNNGVGFNQNELVSTNFPNGTWHHCVCTFYNGSSKIYKNGVLDVSSGSYTGTPTHPHNDEIIRIGGRYDVSILSFKGSIGEARIYPRALTAAQVFQNYNATKSKYIDEAPDVAPKITSDRIVIDSNLVLNYDFGNRATYDRAENLLPWSEDFTKWNQAVHFWENNYAIAPDGSRTAALLKESIPTQQQLSYFNIATMPNVTVASGDTFTFTVFAKANTHDVLEMHMYGDSQANFNLTTGVTTNNGASMSAVGDGWYFCKWTRTKSNTNGAMYLGISASSYAGVGIDKSLFIWHPQVERGYQYGRYIRTSGTSINAPTTVKNLSSSSITGTLNGPVFSGNSFGFDGSNDNISLPGPINAYPFTVCAWVTHNAAWTPGVNLMDEILNMNIAGQRVSCGIVNVASWPGNITLMYGGTSHWTAPTPATTGPGDWHQIVWTVVGSNNPAHAIYLDGVSQTMTDNGGTHGGSAGWSIGSNNTNGEYWPGSIGEIQIYDRVLSAAEVLQNYNATSAKYSV